MKVRKPRKKRVDREVEAPRVPTYYFREGPSMREPEVFSLDQRCGGGRRVIRKGDRE